MIIFKYNLWSWYTIIKQLYWRDTELCIMNGKKPVYIEYPFNVSLHVLIFQIFTRYGKCYTFNSGQDGRPLMVTMKGGMGNGLELMLDIQQDEYLPVWGETGKAHSALPTLSFSILRLNDGTQEAGLRNAPVSLKSTWLCFSSIPSGNVAHQSHVYLPHEA